MKQLLIIALVIICSQVSAFAQEVKVEVRGIRSEKGSIMVMAQKDADSKPILAMTKAVKGKVVIILKDVPWEQCQISLFHDENGNGEMDRDEQGMPAEGYAREKYKREQDAPAVIKTKLYYPAKQ